MTRQHVFTVTLEIDGPIAEAQLRENLRHLLQKGMDEGLITAGDDDSGCDDFRVQ